MRAYMLARNTAGLLAGFCAVGYLVVVLIAVADGDGGIEIRRPLNGLAVGIIVVLTTLAGGAWLIDRGNRAAVEIYVRPIIRNELEQARAEWCAEIADNLAARLSGVQVNDARKIAGSVAHLTIAGVRAAVSDEVEDCMQRVFANGRRYGALMEAEAKRYANTGTDHGVGNVRHLPRQDRPTDDR